jgi:hypothetical protein
MSALTIYQGQVTHHRLQPKRHAFTYPIFMTYVDLEQLAAIEQKFWSIERWNIARFRHQDFGDGSKTPLTQQVQQFIFQETQQPYQGKVFLLCHWRYFGILLNPIALYYCFDAQGVELQYVIAEVTNTPWLQRHRYLLHPQKKSAALYSFSDKALHVSPFMPMDLHYHFDYQIPQQQLTFNMRVHNDTECVFTAQLDLEKTAMNSRELDQFILRYPWMTLKVIVSIYWQALKIKSKGLRFFPHPSKANWRV